ncbi:MAG TPA: hypothetical protein VGI81_27905 [Tepidisphaeraceae bacterium]
MHLLEMLQRIHQANFAGTHGPFSVDRIREYLREDGFEKDKDLPAWFLTMLALVDQRETGNALFECDKGGIASLLLELHETHGWNVDDYGEGLVMMFPQSGVRVFVSREARDERGRGCCSYAVTLL